MLEAKLLSILICLLSISAEALGFRRSCSISKPEDGTAGLLIESAFTKNCLTLKNKNGKFLEMEDCSWHKRTPAESQVFYLSRRFSGTAIQSTRGNFGADGCLTTYHGRTTVMKCNEKDVNQIWRFRRTFGRFYQIYNRQNGNCLRANNRFDGAGTNVVECNERDKRQRWRLCTFQ